MIGLLIFGFILVLAFYAWFPNYTWLIVPIFIGVSVIFLIMRVSCCSCCGSRNEPSVYDQWDEFDWWQDNQGL